MTSSDLWLDRSFRRFHHIIIEVVFTAILAVEEVRALRLLEDFIIYRETWRRRKEKTEKLEGRVSN